MVSEHQAQQAILATLGRGSTRLWRNNTGVLLDRNGRPVNFGLCRGSSDIIGLRSLEIQGQRIAQFVALEVKGPKGRLTPEQERFLALIRQMGGLAGMVRSVEDAEAILSGS